MSIISHFNLLCQKRPILFKYLESELLQAADLESIAYIYALRMPTKSKNHVGNIKIKKKRKWQVWFRVCRRLKASIKGRKIIYYWRRTSQ